MMARKKTKQTQSFLNVEEEDTTHIGIFALFSTHKRPMQRNKIKPWQRIKHLITILCNRPIL